MDQKPTKDEFYIGYQPKAPIGIRQKIRAFLVIPGVVVVIGILVFVNSQSDFRASTFELGDLSTVEGMLSMEPVPMLKVPLGEDIDGTPIVKSILLVGFGKFGARPTLQRMEEEVGDTLAGKYVKLQGTLIYYDSKTLLELSKKERSLVEVVGGEATETVTDSIGEVSLKGEIVDPKCFFGVMKPGEGKPHRSCAARCLSGGIPPVLKVESKEGGTNYFILLGPDGEMINEEILPYVGEYISIKGNLQSVDDWMILRVSDADAPKRLSFMPRAKTPFCTDYLSKR